MPVRASVRPGSGPRPAPRWLAVAALLAAAALAAAAPAGAVRRRANLEAPGHQLFASPQSHALALSPDGSRLYVANTTSGTVDVIDTASRARVATVSVGLDPVSVAVRPDGLEVWVANHVSDSVSVIDTDPSSPTLHHVIETVQDMGADGVTDFDEPVGVAFASNSKAYVALSSRNEIAVVDVPGYAVTARIPITAQDPRALVVRGGRLYVVAFESGNQSELSVCLTAQAGNPQCTFGVQQITGAGANPNLPGIPKNVVRDPDVPDRDLFVFSTADETPVPGSPVSGVGTLLYGLAVSASGDVFVANTEARNNHLDGDGLAAQPPWGVGAGLADLQNRPFRNRITRVSCGLACGGPSPQDLEPAPGSPVGVPLATPFGAALSADDTVLLVTAAASSRLASLDAGTLSVLHTLDVGAIPRSVVFRSTGAIGTAYVLNALDDSVSVVDVGPGGTLSQLTTLTVGDDPTPDEVRLGRIAFESARGSSSGTFACASCHPDGNVDQLLWVIGAVCTGDPGCDQEEMRSTMPIRGLRGTLPLHWDGTLGDPFGGPNGEVGVGGSAPANCSLANGEQECFRQLVDAALAGVMCDQSDGCASGGELDDVERDDMARFLQSVPYPPARSRRMDDALSVSAVNGFADFFLDQGGNGGPLTQTCADTQGGCHAFPLGTSTNSPAVGAFEAPTMRGMTDRFLQFSGGFTAPQEFLDVAAAVGGPNGVIPWNPADGLDELVVFSAGFLAFQPLYNVFPDDMFQMFEEASTGFSGATGRQVTLNQRTTAPALLAQTGAIWGALEAADARGAVNLRAAGFMMGGPIGLAYDAASGIYKGVGSIAFSHADLLAQAQAGTATLTLTGQLRSGFGAADSPQPLLAVATVGPGPGGDPNVPIVSPSLAQGFSVKGTAVRQGSTILVDGAPTSGLVTCLGGTFSPFCSTESVLIQLDQAPPAVGLHVVQLETPAGPQSNELTFCVGSSIADCL